MFSLGISPSSVPEVFKDTGKPIRIAFTADSSSSSPGNKSITTDMIYYSLDPQFTTILFSVYARSERLGISIMPDAFCFAGGSSSSSSSIISYANSVAIQLISLGDYYSTFFNQVRVGSVIFLVGVGSLVCWKLWDFWRNGDDTTGDGGKLFPPKSPGEKCSAKTSSSSSSSKRRTRDFLASFLEEEFVHDIEDMEDEDPALIQGKYFGPEDAAEAARRARAKSLESSPLSSEFSPKSRSESVRQYLADNSDSSLVDGEDTSDQEHYDSLPYDGIPSPEILNQNKKVRRRHRLHGKDRSLSSSPSKSPYNHGMSRLLFDRVHSESQNKNKLQSKRVYPYDQTVGEDFSSSEVSPRMGCSSKIPRKSRISPFASVRRRQGDGSETPDSEEFRNAGQYKSCTRSSKTQRYANNDSDDEDWISDARLQPDGEEDALSDSMFYRRRLSKDLSMSDFMGRVRPKNTHRASLSRENSVSSKLSDFLKRDDSICSNLSEYCASECSEFSLELSYRDDSIANQTITLYADIEDEISNLKSSMNDMDEEFIRFSSIPNPYLLKTTFSDHSFDSDSRPSSALDMLTTSKSRVQFKFDSSMHFDLLAEDIDNKCGSKPMQIIESRKVNFDLMSPISPFMEETLDDMITRNRSKTNHQGGVDYIHLPPAIAYMKSKSEKSRHTNSEVTTEPIEFIASSNNPPKKANSLQKQHSSVSLKRTITQEEILNSLEWDNDCLKQYKEENMTDYSLEGPKEVERNKFLPDHASLELDLETELRGSPSTTEFSGREAIVSSLNPALRNAILNSATLQLYPDECPFRPIPPSSLPLNKSFVSMSSSGMGSSMDSSGLGMVSSFSSSIPQQSPGMTTSIDSAIHSRSGSSSPQPLMQSMMSSGLGASWSEISPDVPDFECSWNNRRRTSGEIKLRKFLTPDEIGDVEAEGGLETPFTHLSPVHELRDRESCEIDENICNNNIDEESENASAFLLSNDNENGSVNENDIGLLTDDNYEILNYSRTTRMGNSATRITTDELPYTTEPSRNQNLTSPPLKAVDDKIETSKYAHQEWKGTTSRSETIRQGYSVIPEELELKFLRRIRGDNYCGVRAVTYQILTNGLPLPNSHRTLNYLMSEINNGATWLHEYSFGRRLSYSKDQTIDGFKECLETLDKMESDLRNCENKDTVLQSRLNEDSTLDVRLCEAVKLNMLASAIQLYKQELNGDQVPLFSMIMFARQRCSNPRELMLNHLNLVGDSAGLEQIEMFLLGYALQIVIQVVRPSCYGKEDFICFYPDENVGVWPEVTLVAEDDRHYNVLVK